MGAGCRWPLCGRRERPAGRMETSEVGKGCEMNKATIGVLGLVACGVSAGVAGAAISGVVGNGQLISPPAIANFPTLTGPLADAWNEQTNVTLPSSGVLVDMFVNGGFMTSGAATPGVVTGVVDSHFLHWTAGPVPQAIGTVTFSMPILGVIFSDTLLDATDALLGWGGTTYPTTLAQRGMNPFGSLVANGNTLQFNFLSAAGFIDIEQVRVLTRAVPAPGGVCLGVLGLAAGLRRRR